MEKVDALDLLPLECKKKSLSYEEAAMKIMEVVYTNPGRFNLLDMDEDSRSDFLLEMLPKFKGLVERYDSAFGPLGAYVYYSLPGMRLSWERRRVDQLAGEQAASASVRGIYESAMEKKTVQVADSFSRWQAPVRGAAVKKEASADLVFKKVFRHPRGLLDARSKIFKQRSALVLALKSAWYIDDESVEKISGYLECSSDDMANTLAEIKDSLVKKNEKREQMKMRRDRAWYFICKYRERLARLEPNSEAWKKTRRRLEYQLSSWKNKNRLLNGCRMTVSPRNSEIAKILQVHPYRISVFLKYAKEMALRRETVFGKETPEEE